MDKITRQVRIEHWTQIKNTPGSDPIKTTSVSDVNDIRKHFTCFYIGDDMGMLSAFDTGKRGILRGQTP